MQIDTVTKSLAQSSERTQKTKTEATSGESRRQAQIDQISLRDRPRWAQVLVQQALQFSLEINGGTYQATKPVAEVTPETLFDYDEVAKNVLQFVTGRIGAARADGKDDDSLAKMMEQARKGVDMGFAEAKKMLGDYATDNEDIKTGIAQSYTLIQEGLDEFEQTLFGDVAETSNVELASHQQAALKIETRQGDKVLLRFNDRWQYQDDQEDQGNRVSLQSSQHFSFSLQGSLDDEEVSAIGKLVKGIDELGHTFFSGNLDELLGKAGELQLDDQQLVGFSLTLKQRSKVSAAYQGNTLQQSLKPLADYLPTLNDWQQQADQRLTPSSQQDLTQSVLAAQGLDTSQRSRFTGFNQRLLDALRLIG